MLALFLAATVALRVDMVPRDETTGTTHHAEKLTLSIGDATPLVLENEPPLPGPSFQLADGRFLLLGWSSYGAGMQSIHAFVFGVRNGEVVLDRELVVTTDRVNAGVVVRGARIGIPEPPRDFVHNAEDWAVSHGHACPVFDLAGMRELDYEPFVKRKGDVFYKPPKQDAPFPAQVSWVDVVDGCPD